LETSTEYKFREQLAKGEAHEKMLDKAFGKFYVVQKVSMDLQRHGIDRVFVARKKPFRWLVEYKSDSKAAETGNAFVETVSVDKDNKPGWLYSTCAQIIAYFIPPWGRVYIVEVTRLRAIFIEDEWPNKCPERKIPNNGYNTVGLLVPLTELRQCCKTVLENVGV